MLMRTEPFRELDRLIQQVFGSTTGTWSRPAAMPMDAYRAGNEFVAAFDLLGGAPEAIELDVERNVLTVKAERRRPTETGEDVELQVAEWPNGAYSRQLFLGDTLDTDHIAADCPPPTHGSSSCSAQMPTCYGSSSSIAANFSPPGTGQRCPRPLRREPIRSMASYGRAECVARFTLLLLPEPSPDGARSSRTQSPGQGPPTVSGFEAAATR